MQSSIEYRGYVITPAPRRRGNPPAWTLEVHISPAGRQLGTRRCRAPNTYESQEVAVARCLAFGRLIVDGKIQPRPKGEATA